jgi:hypothetical protein
MWGIATACHGIAGKKALGLEGLARPPPRERTCEGGRPGAGWHALSVNSYVASRLDYVGNLTQERDAGAVVNALRILLQPGGIPCLALSGTIGTWPTGACCCPQRRRMNSTSRCSYGRPQSSMNWQTCRTAVCIVNDASAPAEYSKLVRAPLTDAERPLFVFSMRNVVE